jgi:hypothetical protein
VSEKSREFLRACEVLKSDLVMHDRELIKDYTNISATTGLPRNLRVPWFVAVQYYGDGRGMRCRDIRTGEVRVL